MTHTDIVNNCAEELLESSKCLIFIVIIRFEISGVRNDLNAMRLRNKRYHK